MGRQFQGNQYRTTIVCVDKYEDLVMSGRFYNPSQTGVIPFKGLVSLLLGIDGMLDGMKCPQAYTETRSFSETVRGEAEAISGELSNLAGKKATFAIKILFRQNTSWQGSVTWIETKKEESFRSVLELIYLMDSALFETITAESAKNT